MNNRSTLIKYHAKNGPGYIKARENQDLTNDDLNVPSPGRNHEKCAVRTCSNTLKDEPSKIFFPFPSDENLRGSWYRACGLDIYNPPKYPLYCCEEHFDLKRETNVAVLRQVAGTGGVIPNLLKDRVVPHRQVVDNPLWSTTRSPPSSGMSSPQSWHQPSTSPGGSSLDCRPSVIQRNGSTDGGPGLSTFSGPKIRVKTASELNNPTPSAPMASRRGRPSNHSKSKRNRDAALYKECAVPSCPINAHTFPDAKFVCAPFNPTTRKIWFDLIGRKVSKGIPDNDTVYVCTNHFETSGLESFKLPKDDTTFHVRVKHGVHPTLNLGGVDTTRKSGNPAPEIIRPKLVETPAAPVPTFTTGSIVMPVSKPAMNPVAAVMNPSQPIKMKSMDTGETGPKKKPVNSVGPTCKKYEPKAMPQYPECKPPCPPEFQCSEVTVVEYSRFYSHFYSLTTRTDQNEFIFSHTEVNSDNPFPDTPRFKFYVDVNSPPHPTPMARVCAFAFATSLSVDLDVILGLLIQNIDRVLNGAVPPIIPTLQLEPVKTEDGANDDLMVYNPIVEAIDISSDSEEEHRRKMKEEPCCDIKEEVKIEPQTPAKSHPQSINESPSEPDHAPFSPVVAPTARQSEGSSSGRSTSGKRPAERNDDSDRSPTTDSGTDVFESMHLCSRCLAQFKSLRKFEEHEREATCKKYTGTYFNCETCGRTYYKFEDLRVHTSVMHKYICPKCSDTFRFRRYLEEHVIKCRGTNELSERMRILIKNTECNAPPQKKTKTDVQSSVNPKLPIRTNVQESTTTPSTSLLRPAVLQLDKAKIPHPTQSPTSTSKKGNVLSGPPRTVKPPRIRRSIGLKSNTTSMSKVPNSSAITQRPLQHKSISSVTKTKDLVKEPAVSESGGVNLQHYSQNIRSPDCTPENQSKLPFQTDISESTIDGGKGLDRPIQQNPRTSMSVAQSSQHANPAEVSAISNGVTSGTKTAPLGLTNTPIQIPQHRKFPALSNCLPDFYNLISDTPVRIKKPLVRTSQPQPVIKPARPLLQRQMNNSAQDAVAHPGAHDVVQDGLTTEIMSPFNRLVHAHYNGIAVTIQNPRAQKNHPSGGASTHSAHPRNQSQLEISVCQSRVLDSLFSPVHLQQQGPSSSADACRERYGGHAQTPPLLDPTQQEPIHGTYAGQVETSHQILFNSILPCQQSNASSSPRQLFPNPSHSSQPTRLPIQSLLDMNTQPPPSLVSQSVGSQPPPSVVSQSVGSQPPPSLVSQSVSSQPPPCLPTRQAPKILTKKNNKGKCKSVHKSILTPLGLLRPPNGTVISNFSDEYVSLAEESITISQEVIDQLNRSVGSQTTLPLIATESSRSQKPRNNGDLHDCKCVITPVCMLQTRDGTPIKNYSEEDITLFGKIVTVSKEVIVEPNKRSFASQTTLPLVASETFRPIIYQLRQESGKLIKRPCIPPIGKSRRTITDVGMLHTKGKPIENFAEEYLAFAAESVTIAHDCVVAHNKRSVASQTTLPLEASKMCRQQKEKPSRQQTRVMNFFKNSWNPDVPLMCQPGWLMKQPKADAIPNPRHWRGPSGFDSTSKQLRKRKRKALRVALHNIKDPQVHQGTASTSSQVHHNVAPLHHGDLPSTRPMETDLDSPLGAPSNSGHVDPYLSPVPHRLADPCNRPSRLNGAACPSSRPNRGENLSFQSQEIDLTGIDFCFS